MKELLLGILQGFTEFLPISSSGHLVFLGSLLNFNSKGVAFELVLHIATFFSIIVYFRKKIIRFYSNNKIIYIIVGILPVGIVGILFKKNLESIFDSPHYLFIFFTLNSIYLLSLRFISSGQKNELNIKKAFIIGVMQIFALFPGISRSGTTITTGIILKLSDKDSFEFSFAMFLPLILGATVLDINNIRELSPSTFIIGFTSAFITGLVALKLLENSLKKNIFPFFGIYTFIIAIISFFLFN